jgi:aryl-alcohol dehydrogenase-like predicted oxidoreductase
MEHRELGRTGRRVSVVGLGTWQLGADWGDVSDADAREVLEAAAEAGVTFYDTADVYGDGRSERLVGEFVKAHPDAGFTVATKMGRRAEQLPRNYTSEHFHAWVDRSRSNLGVDRVDLVQLHCPPTEVIDSDETYDALDTLVQEGSIAAYGVSVETVHQALAAIERPHVATVQIIVNPLRLKPLEKVLPAAAAAGVGVIARVPLASGLLSGKYDEHTTFAADDHRTFNRAGEAFDIGETFAGVPYDIGLRAAGDFSRLVRETGPAGITPAQASIAWIWQQPGVSTVIPGARSREQARSNAAAGEVGPLDQRFLDGVHEIYDRWVRELVHDRW